MLRPIITRCFAALVLCVLAACSEQADPEASFRSAKQLLEQKRYQAGIIELKNTLQAMPDNAEARWLLGETYLEVGDPEAAIKELEKAASLGYRRDEADTMVLRAIAMAGRHADLLDQAPEADQPDATPLTQSLRTTSALALGLEDEARRELEAGLALAGADESLDLALAQTRLALFDEDLRAAGAALARAEAIQAQDFDLHMLQGQYAMVAGDAETAEAAFDKAMKLRPRQAQARIGLINAMLVQRHFATADKEIDDLAGLIPDNPMVEYLRGYSAYLNRKPKVAKDHLLKVVAQAPGHTQSQLLLANILFSEQRYEQAENMVAAILDKAPLFSPALKLMGAIKLQRAQPGEAINTLNALNAEELQDVQALALLGSAYLTHGDVEKGQELLNRAAELAPGSEMIRTQQALGQLRAGNVEQALGELEAIAAQSDAISRADILLIFTHLGAREFDKVIEAADRLAERVPDSPVPLNLKGAAWLGKQDNDKAREMFEAALAMSPDFTPSMVNLANLELAAGNTDAAEARLDEVLKRDPAHTRALLMKAFIVGKGGDNDAGIALLERARASGPNALEPRFLLTRHYLQSGQVSTALTIAREATDIAPDNSAALQLLGRVQMAAGERENALASFRRLAEKHPEAPGALLMLAEAQAQTARIDDARATLAQGLEQAPTDAPLLLAATRLELATGNTDAAGKFLDRLQAIAPDSPQVQLLRGDIRIAAGDAGGAASAYRKAHEASPSIDTLMRLYRAERLGGNDNAVTLLHDWLNEHPEDPAAMLAIAINEQEVGRMDAAESGYEAVLAIAPDNVIALNNLAWIRFEQGSEEAAELAEQARRLAPDSPEVIDTAGWILVQTGKVEQGLGLLRSAVDKAPGIGSIQYHYAAALAKAGDKAAARERLATLLEGDSRFPERDEAQALHDSLL